MFISKEPIGSPAWWPILSFGMRSLTGMLSTIQAITRDLATAPTTRFYVTRHQTPWQALKKAFQNDFGTVRIFDQGGNLLHEQEFSVDDQSGPMCLDRSKDEPARKSEVFLYGWKTDRAGNICFPGLRVKETSTGTAIDKPSRRARRGLSHWELSAFDW